jgi:hypothetical protein
MHKLYVKTSWAPTFNWRVSLAVFSFSSRKKGYYTGFTTQLTRICYSYDLTVGL